MTARLGAFHAISVAGGRIADRARGGRARPRHGTHPRRGGHCRRHRRPASRRYRMAYPSLIARPVARAGLLPLFIYGGQSAGKSNRHGRCLIVAGLLVGFGTRLGSGCTSGHGICGVSRLSPRSIVATAMFMASAALRLYLSSGMSSADGRESLMRNHRLLWRSASFSASACAFRA